MSTADHIPVEVEITFNFLPSTVYHANELKQEYTDWSSLSADDLASYFTHTDRLVCNIELLREAVLCTDSNCSNIRHRADISSMYSDIIKAFHEANIN